MVVGWGDGAELLVIWIITGQGPTVSEADAGWELFGLYFNPYSASQQTIFINIISLFLRENKT